MFKAVRHYLWGVICNAWRGSLSSALNWGGITGAGLLGAIFEYRGSKMTFGEGWQGVVLSGLAYTAVAWIAILILRLIFVAPFQLWRTEKERADGLAELKAHDQDDSFIPNVRVADNPDAVKLFEGENGDKLIPLLEAERLSAWARPMGSGEPPPIKVPGSIWRTHVLMFVPRAGEGTRNQTYVKTKQRGETTFFDVFLNRSQIKTVWPNFNAADSGVSRFVRNREYFTIAHAACLLAETEIRQDEIVGPASGYLYDIKKQILDEKIKPLNGNKLEIQIAQMNIRGG
jgi:hypothetical protein